ncbi:MAG TPA: lactate racemase domain-containing protein [Pirellulales bacterium]|nr:lactate racemase domain-containing protein [Pirellulales bacterium]
MSILRYGADSTLKLDIEPAALLAECHAPRGVAVADPAAVVSAALADPLDFPPLRRAVIPGDRVVLALEPELPQAPALVSSVISTLLEAGAAAADICVLQSRGGHSVTADSLRFRLPAECTEKIDFVGHDPRDRGQLSYLAANEDGEPIYVNRRLFDADVVLPIGCLRLATTPDYFGINAAVYPTFSDAATLDRFRATVAACEPNGIARRRHEANDVAWRLGIMLTVQIVPAAAGGVLHVLAGSLESVERRGSELCKSAWDFEVPRRADLIVAAIEGVDQQTWENFGRAVAAASRAVADDGAIAICTELDTEPGPALEWLGRARDLPDALRHIRRQHTADAPAAHELAQALKRGRVYLMSRLDESVVENLGMAPVAVEADIGRLARRYRSCVLLANAQYAQPTPLEESSK